MVTIDDDDGDCDDQGPHFSAADFAKFRGTVCEIPRHCYSEMPYSVRPVGVIVWTDNTWKYKKFILICNTKTHCIIPFMP